MSSERLIVENKMIAGTLGAAVAALVAITGIYLWRFHSGVSNDQAVWGQFGDYVGGVLNPILGFLSLIALIFTVVLQKSQLEMTREELANSEAQLDATTGELKRAADAQRRMAAALIAQVKYASASARLAALSASLVVLDESIRQVRESGGVLGGGAIAGLRARRAEIDVAILAISGEVSQAPGWAFTEGSDSNATSTEHASP